MDTSTAIIPYHAAQQMAKRLISDAELRDVLERPESVLPVRVGRVVVQAIRGPYLFRVFVDVDREPAEVVTAYRTSKIEKYRSQA
jgi:hypothetical protein